MPAQVAEQLQHDIYCIDANYMKPGLVSFYLVRGGEEYAVIDTGTAHSVATLEQAMQQLNIHPQQISIVAPTHVHLDHAGGAGLMMQKFPNARLLVHPRGARHLVDPTRLVESSIAVYGEALFHQLYGELVPAEASRVVEVNDGDVFNVGDRPLTFRHTPGHADHHYCVWDQASRGWFTGDMFGISYGGFRTPGGDFCMLSTTPTQFRPEAMLESLALLAEAAPQRIYLNHFGELGYTAEKLQMLQDQVSVYTEIALSSVGDQEKMEDAILDYCLQVVARMNLGKDLSHMREEFRFDAQLNAQGLAVWVARR